MSAKNWYRDICCICKKEKYVHCVGSYSDPYTICKECEQAEIKFWQEMEKEFLKSELEDQKELEEQTIS